MNIEREVVNILKTVMGLDGRACALDSATPLLGYVAELDSMAVVSILTAIEEQFGLTVNDDEVDGRAFSSVGSLVSFVQNKLEQ